MASRAIILLLTVGLLYSTNARPVSHEDAENQAITVDDLITDEQVKAIYKSLFPSSSEITHKQDLTINGKHLSTEELNNLINGLLNPTTDAEQQKVRVSFDWAQKQGRRVPYDNGQTQGKTAEEQGWSVTLPDGSTYNWPVQEQGRRIPFAKEQTVDGTNLNDIWNRLFQPSKTVNEQGRRVPFAREQSYWDTLKRIYGFDQLSENAEKEGFTFTLPNGNTIGWGEAQGIRVPFGKAQTLYDPYFGHQSSWFEEQTKKASSLANKQSDDLFSNLYRAWRLPSAKQQMYYPYYLPNGYAKKQTYYPYYPYYKTTTVNENKDVKDMEAVVKELKDVLENEK